VYRINGRNPGPTMMIMGGIQGNEPGGFLSATLYTDLALKTGNLIVVPRANFYSILLFDPRPQRRHEPQVRPGNQGRPGLRNRPRPQVPDGRSDILLNLHDGYGSIGRPTSTNWPTHALRASPSSPTRMNTSVPTPAAASN
jgi:predicted deacylase